MKQAVKARSSLLLAFVLTAAGAVFANGKAGESQNSAASAIRGKEHYVVRDGLRI